MSKTSFEVKVPYSYAVLFDESFANSSKAHQFMNEIVKKRQKSRETRQQVDVH